MTAQEQELLLAELRQKHPTWPTTFCSGYVHGVSDEDRFDHPLPRYIRRRKNPYATGYLLGFLVQRGSDAVDYVWTDFVWQLLDATI